MQIKPEDKTIKAIQKRLPIMNDPNINVCRNL